MFIDVYIEIEDSRCNHHYWEHLVGPDKTLTEAKYLCSIDPTCLAFSTTPKLSSDKGNYYKCLAGYIVEPSWKDYMIYKKGIARKFDILGKINQVSIMI